MLTYEYKCSACGLMFERRQSITDPALTICPDCGGSVQRLISGGSGFILKNAAPGQSSTGHACSLDRSGQTCCGRAEPCGQKPCET